MDEAPINTEVAAPSRLGAAVEIDDQMLFAKAGPFQAFGLFAADGNCFRVGETSDGLKDRN